MEDILLVGDTAYSFSEKSKLQQLDARLFETERMSAVLDTILDKLERMVPENRTVALMNPDQRRVAREQLIDAHALYNEFLYHVDDCQALGHPLVDAPSLSDEAQSLALQKLLALGDHEKRIRDRLTVFSIRMGTEADGTKL